MTQQSNDNGGASRLWTSADRLHVRWRSLVDAGDLRGADALSAEPGFELAFEARDLVARLRWEWSLDADAMLAKLRDALGTDVTATELDAWTASGAIESRVVDGQRRWFRREPRNLILFDPDLRERANRAKPQAADRHEDQSPIVPHLVEVVAAAEADPLARELLPVRTRFDYAIVVKPDRLGAVKGSTVRAWLPFPQVYRQQRDVVLIDSFPKRERVSPKTSPQRTIYFEQKVRDPGKPVRFEASFEYTTSAVMASPGRIDSESARAARPCPDDLAERPPHVVFTPEVRSIVAECSTDRPDPATLAKRLWNWVDDHIPWRAEHEYCLIRSIPAQALAVRRGDCGVQALTYITLCRCAGIPARWQSGWTTDPATGGNLHDWTEVWIDELGWIPVDPSYGKKKHADPRVRDFYFGNLDRYRLIVNLDYGRELTPPKAALRSEPLDFQRGEVEIDGRNLYFDEWDYAFRFTHRDLIAEPGSPRTK